MKELATRMNANQMDCGFIDYILESKSFQHCVKLTNDEDDMAKWFNEFVVSDDSEITALCHRILCKFLSYLKDIIFGQTKSFHLRNRSLTITVLMILLILFSPQMAWQYKCSNVFG